jgi:type II secretory pathway pseudopilin PulG
MGIGAALSVFGSALTFGSQIREKKKEEEERKRQLEEAQRKALGEQGQQQAEAQAPSTERAPQAQLPLVGAQPQQRTTEAQGFQTGYPLPGQNEQESRVLGPELADVFSGLRPGGGGFYV